MKTLFLLLLTGLSLTSFSQQRVSADLYVGEPYLTDAGGGPLNMNSIGIGSVIKLHIEFLSLEQKKLVPQNAFKIVIRLGDKLEIPRGFDLANAPMKEYFTWSSVFKNGEEQIVGELTKVLPADFAGLAVFDLQAKELGKSKAVSQLELNNSALTDPNQKNDMSQLDYTVTSLVPVTFRDFAITSSGCEMKAAWSVEYQFEIDHFEIEASKTGTNFSKINELTTRRSGNYTASLEINDKLKNDVLYLRVKAVGTDGANYYSSTKAVEGDCVNKKGWQLYLYPNPVTDLDYINVASREGTLDGKYRLVLLDKFGKTYQSKEMTLSNVKSLRYPLGANMHTGKYVLQVTKSDNSFTTALEFEVLR